MPKSPIKFYLIAGSLLLILFLIILIVPMGNKKTIEQNTVPTPTFSPSSGKTPTQYPIPTTNPINSPTPTLIPPHFTGVDLTKDIPADVKLLSQQKTELRRKTPLKLSVGTISFNYEADKFALTLAEPKDQSQTAFNTWLKQTYPAISEDQFTFN